MRPTYLLRTTNDTVNRLMIVVHGTSMSLKFLNNKFSVKPSWYDLYQFRLGKVIFSDALGVFIIYHIFMKNSNLHTMLNRKKTQ